MRASQQLARVSHAVSGRLVDVTYPSARFKASDSSRAALALVTDIELRTSYDIKRGR
jgi:hypothetical protein